MTRWLLVFALAGCKQGPDDGTGPATTPTPVPTTPVVPYEDCDLLWERDVVGFFDNWCAPCHSAEIPAEWRQGAPAGVDLDSLEQVKLWAERVRATALIEPPTMPPAGGTSQRERELVTAWLDCGMPGAEVVPVDPCEGAPSVAVSVDDDLSGLCDEGGQLVIDGDVVVDASLSVDCACEVTGSVWLQAPLQASSLRAIGGGLTVSGAASLDAPELTDVGGDLIVTELSVANLYLDDLQSVGGQLWVYDTGELQRLSFTWLRSLGGPLIVADAPALFQLSWPRLATVVGDVRFEGLPALKTLEPLVAVEHVSGELVVSDTAVRLMGDLRGFERIDGGIRVEGNSELVAIDGFWHLTELSTLTVLDNPALQGITGFDVLEHVDGIELRGNPALTDIELVLLSSIGTLGESDQGLLLADAPDLRDVTLPELKVLANLYLSDTGVTSLEGFAGVNTVGVVTLLNNNALIELDQPSRSRLIGGLRLEGNGQLSAVTAFAGTDTSLGSIEVRDQGALQSLELPLLASVAGDLILDELPYLEGVSSLTELAEVDGSLQLTSLGSLYDVTALHGLESVTGDVVVRDNPSLPEAAVVELVQAIDSIGGSVDVGDNGP